MLKDAVGEHCQNLLTQQNKVQKIICFHFMHLLYCTYFYICQGTAPASVRKQSATWFLIFFSVKLSFKYDYSNRYFTWRPAHIYDNISLSSSCNEKCFRQSCSENQTTHFMLNTFFPENRAVYEIMCKSYGRVRQATYDNIRLCRIDAIACRRAKAGKKTHS
jgi:hypothetical protein